MMTRPTDLAVATSVLALRRVVESWRRAGERIALVPTMGALHAGHLALVEHGRATADRVVASVFVNPTQFGANEDLSRYPRDTAGDKAKLAGAGCDLLFMPSVAEMYPDGFSTRIDPGPLGAVLEGQFRPGHFAGVATVVAKLLLQARPDIACFGEKDYQQFQIIGRIVRDLDIPVAIEGVPTVREPDGLSLSSRNAYLDPGERRIATALHRVLREAVSRAVQGEKPGEIAAGANAALLRAGFAKVDYVAICAADSLAPLDRLDRKGRILAAAWLGKTRLIDNLPLDPP